jgi:hypothetical protein
MRHFRIESEGLQHSLAFSNANNDKMARKVKGQKAAFHHMFSGELECEGSEGKGHG